MINNKEKNFVSAVVYVNDCENTVKIFLETLDNELNKNFNSYEIICVNDCSTDNSVKIINDVASNLDGSMLSIVNMGYKQGLEASMNAGLDLAIGDFVYEFDSTILDYDSELILNIYQHSLKGFDIVAASSDEKMKFTSKLFYKLFNKYGNTQYGLTTESFRIISRRGINRVRSLSKTIPYRKALYANCGLKVDVVKYKPMNTAVNSSSQINGERKDTALNTLILFTDVAYKISIILSMIMMLATVGIGIYTIMVYISEEPVAGFTTTMLVMTGSFFGVFVLQAIIIKYLSILIDLSFKKQQYIIESVNKLTK